MNISASELLFPAIGAITGGLIGVTVRAIAMPQLARLASRTANRIDDVLLHILRGPVVLWAALLGAHVGISFAELSEGLAEALHRPIVALVIVSVSWTLGRAASAMVRLPPHLAASSTLPSARILSSAAHVAVVVVGVLVALQTLGVSVTPVLTALGVGGLAIGLALQDTLANLFAGIQIVASRQVRPGDFVQLSTGQQGFVEDITWRDTTVRQLSNNIVIVPNTQLAHAITLNYSLPTMEQAVLVDVGVDYDADFSLVERVTIDVARSVQRDVTGAVRSFEPFIRYHTLGDSSVGFTTIMRAEQFTDNYLMKHEFVKRLLARYRDEQITIPFPQRVLHFDRPEMQSAAMD